MNPYEQVVAVYALSRSNAQVRLFVDSQSHVIWCPACLGAALHAKQECCALCKQRGFLCPRLPDDKERVQDELDEERARQFFEFRDKMQELKRIAAASGPIILMQQRPRLKAAV